ncbi:MAG TPA: putative nucleotidyltransferase substrate binding domain-containing protein [Geobacteraceae bacterium]
MAMFPGAQGGDILAWRGISELVGEIRRRSAEQMSYLLADEGVALLKELKGRLEAEIAFEEEFAAGFSRAMAALDSARYEDELASLFPRFTRLAEEHFLRRGSVVALHALCTTWRDALLCRVVHLVEENLLLEGAGRAPAPFCWLASGSIGRGEPTFCVEPAHVLIYGDIPPGGTGWFDQFFSRALALAGKAGLAKNDGRGTVMKSLWRGSRTEWRREIVEELAGGERGRLDELVRRADLRFLCGDEALAAEMIGVVRSMIEFHHEELRETSKSAAAASRTRTALSFPLPALRGMGKGIAEMPTGLDFFSRLRVEKRGRQRGKFDLEQFALAPLVTNIRMLAIYGALHETGTIARIKGLQAVGVLSVELTERLLRAYHDFTRLKIGRQLAEGCESEQGCFIDPQALTADEGERLRNGLETVAGLEKIAYLRFTEQG